MSNKNLRGYFYTLNAYGGDGLTSEADYLWDLFTNTARYQHGTSTVQALNTQTNKLCELREVVQSLLKTEEPIGRLRGRVHHYEGVPVIVTYHPAYLLRTPADKAKAWADLCLAMDIANTPLRR